MCVNPTLLRLYVTTLAITTTESLVAMIVPTYLDTAGFAPDLIGMLVAFFSASALLSRFPAGGLFRGETAQRLLRAGLALLAGSALLYPLSSGFVPLAVARVVGGLGLGIASTTALASAMHTVPAGSSSHRLLAAYSTMIVVGFTVGRGIGGPIADLAGYPAAFGVAACIALIGALCAPKLSAAKKPASSKDKEPAKKSAGGGASWHGRLALLANPSIARVALTALALNFLLSTSVAFFPLYARVAGLSLTEISGIMSMHSLSQVLVRPLSGEVTRRFGHRRVVGVAIVLLVVTYVLIAQFDTLAPLAVLIFMVGVLRALAVVANTITLAEDIPDRLMNRGAASSLYNSAKDVGDISGPLVSGLVAAQIGLGNLFLTVPPFVLVIYGLSLLGLSRFESRRRARLEPGV